MKHNILLMVSILLCCFSTIVIAEDHALIITIADYDPHPTNPARDLDLDGPIEDKRLMTAVVKKLGFQTHQISYLEDQAATAQAIRQAFTDLSNKVGPTDKALIYYSGHGVRVADDNGDETDDTCDEALFSSDLEPIRDDEINVFLDKLQAQEVLLLVDSCFSGTIYRGAEASGKPKFIRDQNVICSIGSNGQRSRVSDEVSEFFDGNIIGFSASANNELAMDSPSGGEFTIALHNTIMSSPNLSFWQLKDSLANRIRIKLPPSHVHTPQLFGPTDWLHKSVFDFGNLSEKPITISSSGDTLATARNFDTLFDRILRDKDFKVDIQDPDNPVLDANAATYRLGEPLSFEVESIYGGYIYIFEIGVSGNLTLLFPNNIESNNYFPQSSVVNIPDPKTLPFILQATEPVGQSRVLSLVTSKKLDLLNNTDLGADPTSPVSTFAAVGAEKVAQHIAVYLASSRDIGVFSGTSDNYVGLTPENEYGAGELHVEVYR